LACFLPAARNTTLSSPPSFKEGAGGGWLFSWSPGYPGHQSRFFTGTDGFCISSRAGCGFRPYGTTLPSLRLELLRTNNLSRHKRRRVVGCGRPHRRATVYGILARNPPRWRGPGGVRVILAVTISGGGNSRTGVVHLIV